jgi:hypothetical protein
VRRTFSFLNLLTLLLVFMASRTSIQATRSYDNIESLSTIRVFYRLAKNSIGMMW